MVVSIEIEKIVSKIRNIEIIASLRGHDEVESIKIYIQPKTKIDTLYSICSRFLIPAYKPMRVMQEKSPGPNILLEHDLLTF